MVMPHQLLLPTTKRRIGRSARFPALFLVVTCFSGAVQADRSWNYSYSPEGFLESVDGPRVDVADLTTFAYDTSGNVTRKTNAIGQVTQFGEYNALGLPGKVTDPNGVVTNLTYDWRGSVTRRDVLTSFGTASWRYEYDPSSNRLTDITGPDGVEITYDYDDAHRLTSVSIEEVGKVEFDYDLMGNVTAQRVRDPAGAVVRRHSQAFDELGRLIRRIRADGDETHYSYDANSNLVSVTDAYSRETKRAYDALNRLSKITDPMMGEVVFTYDAADNLISVTDARGVETRYDYNYAGDQVAVHSPDTGITSFEYDEAGNVIRRVDARDIETLYEYDELNRLVTIQYPANPEENISYSYDDTEEGNFGVGRLTAVTDRTGTTQYIYDELGRVVEEQRVIESQRYITEYHYNLAGWLTGLVYPSGRIVEYQYDNAGRVTAMSTAADAQSTTKDVVTDVSTLPLGPVTALTYGNGLTREMNYDQDYQLISQASSVLSRNYLYSDIDNIIGITDNLDSSQSQTFDYDPLSRLTRATGSYGQIDYSYDANGNRLSRNIVDGSSVLSEMYTYASDSHRLLNVNTDDDGAISTRTLQYSDAGNVVQDVRPNRTLDLVYNQQNRLEEVQEGGQPFALYLNNALGQRVIKVAASPSANRHFIYDQSGRLIVESSANGEPIREYLYLHDTPVALIDSE